MSVHRGGAFGRRREPAAPVRPAAPGRHLRRVGVVILSCGLTAAALLYWVETRRAGPSIEDLLPGSRAAASRQTGLLYGRGVQSLWEIYQELKQPAGQAGLVAIAAIAIAAGCLRAAWLRDREDA